MPFSDGTLPFWKPGQNTDWYEYWVSTDTFFGGQDRVLDVAQLGLATVDGKVESVPILITVVMVLLPGWQNDNTIIPECTTTIQYSVCKKFLFEITL